VTRNSPPPIRLSSTGPVAWTCSSSGRVHLIPSYTLVVRYFLVSIIAWLGIITLFLCENRKGFHWFFQHARWGDNREECDLVDGLTGHAKAKSAYDYAFLELACVPTVCLASPTFSRILPILGGGRLAGKPGPSVLSRVRRLDCFQMLSRCGWRMTGERMNPGIDPEGTKQSGVSASSWDSVLKDQ